MKSRITIEVDFDNSNTPVIQIIRAYSDDVRDRLVASFIESVKHDTHLLSIEYKGEAGVDPDSNRIIQRWAITPITNAEFEKKAMTKVNEMATESLSPDRFTEWGYVSHAMKMVRSAFQQ